MSPCVTEGVVWVRVVDRSNWESRGRRRERE